MAHCKVLSKQVRNSESLLELFIASFMLGKKPSAWIEGERGRAGERLKGGGGGGWGKMERILAIELILYCCHIIFLLKIAY